MDKLPPGFTISIKSRNYLISPPQSPYHKLRRYLVSEKVKLKLANSFKNTREDVENDRKTAY